MTEVHVERASQPSAHICGQRDRLSGTVALLCARISLTSREREWGCCAALGGVRRVSWYQETEKGALPWVSDSELC